MYKLKIELVHKVGSQRPAIFYEDSKISLIWTLWFPVDMSAGLVRFLDTRVMHRMGILVFGYSVLLS